MKLIVPLLVVIIALALLARSCAARAQRGEEKEAAAGILPEIPNALRGEKGELLAPITTQSYRFKYRRVPAEFREVQQTGGDRALRVLVDEPTGTVVFVGPLDEVARWKAAAEVIDLQPSTAYAKCWVFWVAHARGKGLDVMAEFGSPRVTAHGSITGPIVLGQVSLDWLTLRMEFLSEIQDVVILQTPHLRFVDGLPARIQTGTQVPVPVENLTETGTRTTVEFKQVGLELELTPRFFSADQLEVTVAQKNDFIERDVAFGQTTVPQISSQTLDSTVRVRMGEVVLIGGVETYLSRTTKRFLAKATERESGYLYVLLSAYGVEPVAVPVVEDLVPAIMEEIEGIQDELDGAHPLLPAK